MPYPKLPNLHEKINRLYDYVSLRHEYGAKGLETPLLDLEKAVDDTLEKILAAPVDEILRAKEPDCLEAIKKLRPDGPRRIWKKFDADVYADRLAGAFLGRMAGCTLGAIVELWDVSEMEKYAAHYGLAFPPKNYWTHTPWPYHLRYGKSACSDYTLGGIKGVPVDDDITYTLLGLLIAEDCGLGFTREDAANAWVKYLPYACTGEDIALKNLKSGVSVKDSADIGNPFCQWIGADIRCDPFGYLAPGLPEKAAAMAYNESYVSHRRNGIYGSMFFAAAIAAAFATGDAIEAVRIGMTEIPAECSLYKDIEWALSVCPTVRDYKDGRAAVDERFAGMHPVHTNNNACLTIFGVSIGGGDTGRAISETVAMGMDNDCTGATAGSLAGAAAGMAGLSPHWYKDFDNTVFSYLNHNDEFTIDDVLRRFAALAEKNF